MNRRKSLQILGGSAVGIAGLVLAEWKWDLLDQLSHEGFFSFHQEQTITAIADTIIPAGLPPRVPNSDAQPIGALSTGTDKFLIRLFEHCYEVEDQQKIKKQLDQLRKKGFLEADKEAREQMLLALERSELEEEQQFFKVMKAETITGFTTVKEVMVDYRNYKVAPGMYLGCVDVTTEV
ncbi:gluconate 2-dehydrogenase subunit 3 family protein [Algoriphagus namhaensis]